MRRRRRVMMTGAERKGAPRCDAAEPEPTLRASHRTGGG
jgi:hypothetical protein